MRREVEILLPVLDDRAKVLAVLAAFEDHGETATQDVYLCGPAASALDPDADGRLRECLRVRVREGKSSLTFKRDKFDADGTWLYSDEAETIVADGEETLRIFSELGFRELVTIESVKRNWTGPGIEITFEEVKGLGNFIEVERLGDVEEGDVPKAKEELRNFVSNLGLHVGEELNAGKPELLLRKRALHESHGTK